MTFVPNGNQPLPTDNVHHTKVLIDLDWFTKQLEGRLGCHLEIAWGNHVGYFHEVLAHGLEVMDLYIRHRNRLFHADALLLALHELEA